MVYNSSFFDGTHSFPNTQSFCRNYILKRYRVFFSERHSYWIRMEFHYGISFIFWIACYYCQRCDICNYLLLIACTSRIIFAAACSTYFGSVARLSRINPAKFFPNHSPYSTASRHLVWIKSLICVSGTSFLKSSSSK